MAAVTGATYAVASALNKKNNLGLFTEKSGSSKNNFEIFGADHFLTKFDSIRSFDHLPGHKRKIDNRKKTIKLVKSHQDEFQPYRLY